jgi:hypothetical protein
MCLISNGRNGAEHGGDKQGSAVSGSPWAGHATVFPVMSGISVESLVLSAIDTPRNNPE